MLLSLTGVTRTPNLKIAAGMSREEMDMIIQYLSQQRAALGCVLFYILDRHQPDSPL